MAANGKSLPQMILKSAINLDLFKPPYFGDSKEDHEFIEFGINLYKEKDKIKEKLKAKEKEEKKKKKLKKKKKQKKEKKKKLKLKHKK